MKAIQKELGEDTGGVELDELDEKIKEAKMPEKVEKVARKELIRMQKIPAQSPEYTVARTYLDWLVELPWSRNPRITKISIMLRKCWMKIIMDWIKLKSA